MKLNNLLLIAGSGRNSGKTTIACRIVEQFSHLGIISVKISPHIHSLSEGLIHLSGKPGYEIFEETRRDTSKDTSRMLRSGAEKAYYIQSADEYVKESFSVVYKSFPSSRPIICESPALINYAEPGLFILMIPPDSADPKEVDTIRRHPHLEFTLDEISQLTELPVSFAAGLWKGLK